MTKKAIRTPKGPATIFLITAVSYFITLLNTVLMSQLFSNLEEPEPLVILKFVLLGATNLFMSIVLFAKKYDNLLTIATGTLLLTSVSAMLLSATTYVICDIIFYLLLTAFTFITVKMPETAVREKAVKLRFVIPVLQFVLILISTIQTIQILYEKVAENIGASPVGAMNTAITLLPLMLSVLCGILPILCYVWLTNWLADPYEK